jgi:uncharacterized membrane protein YkoI
MGTLLGLLAAAMLPALTTDPAHARRDDHERALRDRDEGRIVPLQEVLQGVARQFEGRMIKVELDHARGRDDRGGSQYDIRWLLPDGRVLEIEVDAASGDWRSIEGPRLETAFRRRTR